MDEITTTPAQENYIETIHALLFNGPVRPSMLADTLGVRRSSVSKFLSTLVEKGLVHHVPRGNISLTPQGVELAKAIRQRDRCLTRLLVDVCNMDRERAGSEVHQLEHLISDEVLFRLETLVEFACSSGAWLKRLHLRMERQQSQTKKELKIKAGRSQVHQAGVQEKN